MGIRVKEIFLVQQAKCQTLKTLKKSFNIFFTETSIHPLFKIPVKNIVCVVELIFFHGFVVNPESTFQKMNLELFGFS